MLTSIAAFVITVPATAQPSCELLMVRAADAPVIDPPVRNPPPRRPPDVRPLPTPDVRPPPRRAPNPRPDRPVRPTYDPKDIVVADFYVKDAGGRPFWNALSPVARDRLLAEVATERAALEGRYRAAYGVAAEAGEVLGRMVALFRAVAERERTLGGSLETHVRDDVEREFGLDTLSALSLGIGGARPPWHDPGPQPPPRMFKVAPKGFDIVIARREAYNALAQAEGWRAMDEFVADRGGQLGAHDPQALALYRELDLVTRLGQHVGVERLPSVHLLRLPGARARMGAGREVVRAEFEKVQGPGGRPELELKSVAGRAMGVNAWALAHEAAKAAFQIATVLEAAPRATLDVTERGLLDAATNSPAAELRQGLIGGPLRARFARFAARLTGDDSRAAYFRVVEAAFTSRGPDDLRGLLDDLFTEPPVDVLRAKYAGWLN